MINESSSKARTISPREKQSTIQHGYRKCGTRARVFSQTLAHGNSKIEIRRDIYKGRIKASRKE